MSVASPECLAFGNPGSEFKRIHQLTKTCSSPFLYPPPQSRVPPTPSTEYPNTDYRVPPLPNNTRDIYDRAQNRKSYFQIPASLPIERGKFKLDDEYNYEDKEESVVLYPAVSNVPNVPLDVPVRLMVLGSPQVGKSALTLRYLTKHQCDNEISTSVRNGRQRSPNIAVEVEILKILPKNTNKLGQNGPQLKICDAIIVMYSITDRVSFHVARELLEDLANLGDIICPVLLMANKLDLHHHRKVSVTEGRELCRSFTPDIITFQEVSVAHCPEDIMRIFSRLIQSIRQIKNPDIPEILPNAKNITTESSTDLARARKISVFNVAGRMLNNLMGRNSMPPELPSKSVPNSPTMAEGSFSFKNVFKKRSL